MIQNTQVSVESNTFNKVAQCLICKLRGPGIKRGNGSGMSLEEGED